MCRNQCCYSVPGGCYSGGCGCRQLQLLLRLLPLLQSRSAHLCPPTTRCVQGVSVRGWIEPQYLQAADGRQTTGSRRLEGKCVKVCRCSSTTPHGWPNCLRAGGGLAAAHPCLSYPQGHPLSIDPVQQLTECATVLVLALSLKQHAQKLSRLPRCPPTHTHAPQHTPDAPRAQIPPLHSFPHLSPRPLSRCTSSAFCAAS